MHPRRQLGAFYASTNRAFQALNLEIVDKHILFGDGEDSAGDIQGGSDNDWLPVTRIEFRLKQERRSLVPEKAKQDRTRRWQRQ